jgi:hypothetical protein
MKKTMAAIMCIILLMETTACHSYIDLTSLQEYEANQAKPRTYVLHLLTDQYDTLNFSEKFPGRMIKDEVVGIQHVLLYKFNNDSILFKSKRNLTPIYAVKNGVNYRIVNQYGKNLVCNASDTIRIPFSDITQMHIKRIDQDKSLLFIGGVVVGGAGLVYLIVKNLTFDLDMDLGM